MQKLCSKHISLTFGWINRWLRKKKTWFIENQKREKKKKTHSNRTKCIAGFYDCFLRTCLLCSFFFATGCRAKMTLWSYMKSRWLHVNSLYTVQWFARSKLLDPIRLFWTVVNTCYSGMRHSPFDLPWIRDSRFAIRFFPFPS